MENDYLRTSKLRRERLMGRTMLIQVSSTGPGCGFTVTDSHNYFIPASSIASPEIYNISQSSGGTEHVQMDKSWMKKGN